MRPEVAVIGGGLIGSAISVAAANRGAVVTLVSIDRPGAASPAAAGMLAPSIERAARTAASFALASRAAFPDFVREIEKRSGIPIPLQRSGILEIALTEPHAAALRSQLPAAARWLDNAEVHALEPAVADTAGGVLWEEDGCVDNVVLLTALWAVIRRIGSVRVVNARADAIEGDERGSTVHLAGGGTVTAGWVVLASGAWASQIRGAPFAAHVEPVRGQIVVLDRAVVSRPVYSDDSYIVPRAGRTLAGSTMERVGFDARTSADAAAGLCRAAVALCPALAGLPPADAWAGLRPVTPDLLPIVGRDPNNPSLIYACGHSRNGVLMAPTTATAVAQLIFEDSLTFDLGQFRPERFRDTFRES